MQNSGGTISDIDFLNHEISIGVGFDSDSYIKLMTRTWRMIQNRINPKTSIEIGAGTGVLLSIMAKHIDAYGIDPMRVHIDYAVENDPNLRLRYHCTKAQDLLIDRIYDIAVSIEVFEHIPIQDCLEILEKFSKSCRYFWFSSTPHITPNDAEWGHININTINGWIAYFNACGWNFLQRVAEPTSWSLLFMSRNCG